MNGPWHYTEAERLIAGLNRGSFGDGSPIVRQDDVPAILLAQVHATLAAASASTVLAFFDAGGPELWAEAFSGEQWACRKCGCTQDRACIGGCSWVNDPEGGWLCSRCAAPVETPEQSEANATPGYAGDDEQGQVLPSASASASASLPQPAEAEIFDGQQGDLQAAYVRNRAEGRDPVESAARAIVGLT